MTRISRKDAASEQSESRLMRAAAAAKFPANILGMNSITGTSHGQTWMQTLPEMRYFNVITMRTRQNADQDFAEVAKMAVPAAERSMDDQPVALYQVVSGAPNASYVFFEPAASLKVMDIAPERSRNRFEAMGDAGAKRFMKQASETIAQQEALLFAIEPKMSYVSQQIVAGDPAFWAPAEPLKDAKFAGKRSK